MKNSLKNFFIPLEKINPVRNKFIAGQTNFSRRSLPYKADGGFSLEANPPLAEILPPAQTVKKQSSLTGFIFWLPVIVYCGIIFAISSMSKPLPAGIEISRFDKLLHAVEYGILCFLIIRALRGAVMGLSGIFALILAVSLATLYGVSDEFHQMVIPGRNPDIYDLLFDFIGAATVAFIKK
ncbi:MAG: VanZ family protein [Candidatus Omnitrophota bacterium]